MRLLHIFWRLILYLWVLPGSLVGLIAALIGLVRGGGWQVVDGVLEIYGGGVTQMVSRVSSFFLRRPQIISAITLGHVVVGATQHDLERTRLHERVHVRQYERWGPFFIPAYLLASFWIKLRRRGDPYLDNPFEVEAYDVSDGRESNP